MSVSSTHFKHIANQILLLNKDRKIDEPKFTPQPIPNFLEIPDVYEKVERYPLHNNQPAGKIHPPMLKCNPLSPDGEDI